MPEPTARIRFREMTDDDHARMLDLLGDPRVMAHYPSPFDAERVRGWIAWSRRNYAEHGFGLWIIETLDGGFLGDCGLTWQQTDAERVLEVGYHLRPEVQGRGYATEAAEACVRFAREHTDESSLAALVDERNAPSRAVAERLGMTERRRFTSRSGGRIVLLAMPLD